MLRTLEKYEILEEIGHGGMATVYRARDTRLDRMVALKVLHPHLRGSKEARARFRREAQGVARLRHPGILEIYDYSGEDSEESYIATELLTGPTLKKFAEDHPDMPAEIAACFAICVARALSAAHENGIIHRDVKPENILIHEARCVKLTDFGIADMVDSHTMTATGQILGSPGHMAPEQIEGKDCDARSDVFSLGTVLYYLACGRLPFTGRNPHQVLKRISEGDYPDPLRVRPAIGGKMRAIIVRALAHAREDRYPSAADFEKDLTAFVSEIGIDDPEALLARYLQNPDAVTAEVTQRTIAACTELGKKARDAGDIPGALDYFGRVLALDHGHPEVLALVESVGRAQRRRSRQVMALAAIAGLAIVGGGWIALASIGPPPPSEAAVEPRTIPSERHEGDAGGEPVSAGAETGGTSVEATNDAGAGNVRAGIEAQEDAGSGMTTVARLPDTTMRSSALSRRALPVVARPRFVRFFFDPMDVRASVDGAPFRVVGPPDFNGIELTPGPHRIALVSNHPCCGAVEQQFIVEPGEGDQPLRITLPSRPATLVVRCRVPGAQVTIEGLGRRPANEAIMVPIGPSRAATVRFVVTAEGYHAYSGEVRLAAGGEHEESVTLQPQEPAP
jgi:serine/threonine-protein kinase